MNQEINYSEISYKKSGARLKELLRSYGITQKEFGEKFGYTQQHISQIINRAKVVDTNDLDVVTSLSSTEYETSDTAKTINTYFCHNCIK